jgi:hypothetical protein
LIQQNSIVVAPDVADTFVVKPHVPEPSVRLTKETKPDSAIPFLDVLVVRKGNNLAIKVLRKFIHTSILTITRIWKFA